MALSKSRRMPIYLTEFKSPQQMALVYSDDPDKPYWDSDKPPDLWNYSAKDYNRIIHDIAGAEIHLAWYGYGSYSGSSLVIYEKDGQLYEVNGSHCSCNGLEGQWHPEKTSWKALAMRSFGDYEGAEEAQQLLNDLISKHSK